jgi:hypothetical protein
LWLTSLIQTLQKALQDLLAISGGNPPPVEPKPPVTPPAPPATPPHAPVGQTYGIGDVNGFLSVPYQLPIPCTVQFQTNAPVWLSWTPTADTLKKYGRMTLRVDGADYDSGTYANSKGISIGPGAHSVSFIPFDSQHAALWLVIRDA